MRAARKSRLTRLVLKLASVAVAIAAVAVGVRTQDTSLDRTRVVAPAPVTAPAAPRAALAVQRSDVWSADKSAAGARSVVSP